MGISLQQLYEKTRDKFKLNLLAGEAGMSNEVTRLYYMEDMMISNWTRRGELIVTTAMAAQKQDDWLKTFVDSLLPFEPSGIIVNLGGYIEEIPEEIITYCNEKELPFLTFPWEMFLQDIQQDFTNHIFEAEQRDSNISNAFLNAIYVPESRVEYAYCLERNGFGRYNRFCVAKAVWQNSTTAMAFARGIQRFSANTVVISRENETILVFCGDGTAEPQSILVNAMNELKTRYGENDLYLGLGSMVSRYDEVAESWKRADECSRFAEKRGQSIVSFEELGLIGLLLTCDRVQMERYLEQKLGILKQYDVDNQQNYLDTLECFVRLGGNSVEVAKELYVHRNTVNYRLKKIKEILDTDFSRMQDFVDYQMAFYMDDLL